MSAYLDQVEAGDTGFFGVGLTLKSVVSDVYGHFGAGITLATNFLLVVVDQNGSPIDSNTPYTLSYYNPTTGQQVILPLFHNPGVPYQASLPESQTIAFTLDAGTRYLLSGSPSIVIAPNTFGVLRVQLAYPPGTVYSRLIRKRFQ